MRESWALPGPTLSWDLIRASELHEGQSAPLCTLILVQGRQLKPEPKTTELGCSSVVYNSTISDEWRAPRWLKRYNLGLTSSIQ